MKEQIGRNQRSQHSFPHTSAHVSPGSTLAAENSQNQKAAHASFSGRARVYITLVGLVAIIAATFLIMQPFHTPNAARAAGSVGFHISGRSLLDVNGNNFVIRGISHPYTWYLGQNSSFGNIKATGANTVRVVMNGSTSYGSVQTAVSQCKNNKLVCVVEDHDTTGYNGSGYSGSLAQAVSFWQGVQGALTGQENWVIINIGNEAWSNTNMNNWVSATKSAIVSMRNAGFRHTLMVDGPGWGQDPNSTMLYNASSIEAADPMHNTIFSVHMYGVYANGSTVDSYISNFYNTGMPLVIGEFGATQSGQSLSDDANQIMSDAQSRGIGYMAWSWSGNDAANAYLDMTINFNPGQLTNWGNRVVYGTNGLKQTSHECSCYGSSGGSGGGGGGTGAGGSFSGTYKLISRNSGQALDVIGASTANGAYIDQWPYGGTANQKWNIISAGSGYYKLISLSSGKALDVEGQSTANGAYVDQWPDSGTANQQWSLVSVGSGYYKLISRNSGQALDVVGQSTAQGARVDQWPDSGTANQQWSIVHA